MGFYCWPAFFLCRIVQQSDAAVSPLNTTAMSYTPVGRLLTEALAVGLTFVIIFLIVHAAAMAVYKSKAMSSHTLLAVQAALAAALFHIVCEYTGINEWYCKGRIK